jgi:hypothetical protein
MIKSFWVVSWCGLGLVLSLLTEGLSIADTPAVPVRAVTSVLESVDAAGTPALQPAVTEPLPRYAPQDTGPGNNPGSGSGTVPGSSPCTGTCSFFYDLAENRWHLGPNDCSVDCHCVFPIEQRSQSGNIILECSSSIPASFELTLDLIDSEGGFRETKLRFPTLPSGTRRWAARNYRVAIERGNYWDIRIEYDNPVGTTPPSPTATPIPVTPGDTVAKSVIVFGTGADDRLSVDHPTGNNRSTEYAFNGFKVNVSRTSR